MFGRRDRTVLNTRKRTRRANKGLWRSGGGARRGTWGEGRWGGGTRRERSSPFAARTFP